MAKDKIRPGASKIQWLRKGEPLDGIFWIRDKFGQWEPKGIINPSATSPAARYFFDLIWETIYAFFVIVRDPATAGDRSNLTDAIKKIQL